MGNPYVMILLSEPVCSSPLTRMIDLSTRLTNLVASLPYVVQVTNHYSVNPLRRLLLWMFTRSLFAAVARLPTGMAVSLLLPSKFIQSRGGLLRAAGLIQSLAFTVTANPIRAYQAQHSDGHSLPNQNSQIVLPPCYFMGHARSLMACAAQFVL
jgi:hypothetical protein